MSWRDDAACRGVDPDLFYPPKGSPVAYEPARALCASCPVAADCLDYALATFDQKDDCGMWAGTTPMQRRDIRKERGIQATSLLHCHQCGAPFTVTGSGGGQHNRLYCSHTCRNKAWKQARPQRRVRAA